MNRYIKSYYSSFQNLSSEAWILSLVMLLNRIGGMVLPFLTVYLITVLNFKTDEAGLVMSFFGVGALLGSIVGGWLTDKLGHFPIQFLSLLLTVPVFIVLAHIKTIVEITITILILSFIIECFRPANSAAISFYTKKENLTRSFSLNRMAINLGFSFGPALGGFLAAFSWMWLFYGNSIGTFLAATVLFIYFFRRKNKPEADKTSHSEPKSTEVDPSIKTISPYRDKWFLVFSFFCFLYGCIFFQLISILPMYYEQIVHINNTFIGLLLAYNGVFVFIVEMPLVQYAEKKFNVFLNLAIGGFALLLAFAWLLIDHSLLSCFISMTFLSISEILVMPFMTTVAAQRSGIKNRGAYMGLNGLSISMAFIFMPYLATKVIIIYSYAHLWWINLLILTITIIGFYWSKFKLILE